MNKTDVVREIKKDWLRAHLSDIEALIRDWLIQLRAPGPFHRSDSEAWPIVYLPIVERDADNNHMLRKHVRSRTLWRHHAEWEKSLGVIKGVAKGLSGTANSYVAELVKERSQFQLRPTALFAHSALEEAFNQSAHNRTQQGYEPSKPTGVMHGNLDIEEAASHEQISEVEKAHKQLVELLRGSPGMSGLVTIWHAAEESEGRMSRIIGYVLKAHDILYPCRFCKRLFGTASKRMKKGDQ